ncbi:MFS transporter [Buchnera aphidicola]|uniref:MFS transporter n=1 Tax=Buchnera aphidicola TaxID=9 RepID=UPI003BEF4099
MNFIELQVTLSLGVIFLLRMLGIFIIIPVISTHGIFLHDENKLLIGLAMGIYGIAQVIFQFPFGFLSDIFGRKFIMILGLILILIGNIISASIHSIWGLIIGRFLQGSGAISGVSMALLSDFVREKNRTKSIGFIGISFAISFIISMVSGPIIVQYLGFFSIFWITSFLSLICIIIAFFFIPSSINFFPIKNCSLFNIKLLNILFNTKLIKYYVSVFYLHFLLMMNFMIIPNQLEIHGLSFHEHWKIYLFTILLSFLIVFLVLFFLKLVFFLEHIIECSIILFSLSDIMFVYSKNHIFFLLFGIQIFFISFNLLEVFLPSYLSKQVRVNYKGSIMSIYSTLQFLGIFLGSLVSGSILHFFNINSISIIEFFIILSWLLIVFLKK